jgi:hypothetical protein
MVERRRLQQQTDERQARLARIDAKLRTLNESREATTDQRVRDLLDAKLDGLARQRDALDHEAAS